MKYKYSRKKIARMMMDNTHLTGLGNVVMHGGVIRARLLAKPPKEELRDIVSNGKKKNEELRCKYMEGVVNNMHCTGTSNYDGSTKPSTKKKIEPNNYAKEFENQLGNPIEQLDKLMNQAKKIINSIEV